MLVPGCLENTVLLFAMMVCIFLLVVVRAMNVSNVEFIFVDLIYTAQTLDRHNVVYTWNDSFRHLSALCFSCKQHEFSRYFSEYHILTIWTKFESFSRVMNVTRYPQAVSCLCQHMKLQKSRWVGCKMTPPWNMFISLKTNVILASMSKTQTVTQALTSSKLLSRIWLLKIRYRKPSIVNCTLLL